MQKACFFHGHLDPSNSMRIWHDCHLCQHFARPKSLLRCLAIMMSNSTLTISSSYRRSGSITRLFNTNGSTDCELSRLLIKFTFCTYIQSIFACWLYSTLANFSCEARVSRCKIESPSFPSGVQLVTQRDGVRESCDICQEEPELSRRHPNFWLIYWLKWCVQTNHFQRLFPHRRLFLSWFRNLDPWTLNPLANNLSLTRFPFVTRW